MAMTYQKQGRWKEAETLLLQATGAFKRLLGAEHPDTLGRTNALALIYMKHKVGGHASKHVRMLEPYIDIHSRQSS